jgi:4-oxalocrotonate tautomerase
MPLIQVTLAEGRTPEQLRALGEAITKAAETTLGAKRESIRVVLTECAPDMWFVGGRTLAELRASDQHEPDDMRLLTEIQQNRRNANE